MLITYHARSRIEKFSKIIFMYSGKYKIMQSITERGAGNGERKMTVCFISAHRAPNYKIGFLHLCAAAAEKSPAPEQYRAIN
jgi:hypothetical protein